MNSIPFREEDIPETPQVIAEELWFDQRWCPSCKLSFRFFMPHINVHHPEPVEGRGVQGYSHYYTNCPICNREIELYMYKYTQRLRREIEARLG